MLNETLNLSILSNEKVNVFDFDDPFRRDDPFNADVSVIQHVESQVRRGREVIGSALELPSEYKIKIRTEPCLSPDHSDFLKLRVKLKLPQHVQERQATYMNFLGQHFLEGLALSSILDQPREGKPPSPDSIAHTHLCSVPQSIKLTNKQDSTTLSTTPHNQTPPLNQESDELRKETLTQRLQLHLSANADKPPLNKSQNHSPS